MAQQVDLQRAVVPAGLFRQEVDSLKTACKDRFHEKGRPLSMLLALASLITAIWTGIMLGAATGFVIGVALFLIGSPCLRGIYDHFRNRDYLEVSQALDTNDFQRFIADKRLDLSIDSILGVHKAFQGHLRNQLHDNIAQQPQPARA